MDKEEIILLKKTKFFTGILLSSLIISCLFPGIYTEASNNLPSTFKVGDDFDFNLEKDKVMELLDTPNDIDIEELSKVTVIVDGELYTYLTTATTVEEFLEEAEIKLTRYDNLSEPRIALIDSGLVLKVEKAFKIDLIFEGNKDVVWTTKRTVRDILSKEDIEINKNHIISPSLNEVINKNENIEVTLTETEQIKNNQVIPYNTKEKEDDSLFLGERKLKTKGKDGKLTEVFEVTKENNKVINKKLINEIKEEPKDEVVFVGTKPKTKKVTDKNETSNTSQGESKVNGKTLTMDSTAYGPDCSGCSGKSATGMDLTGTAKVVAVDPNVIPLGSKVWVEGYGEAIAGDTGGAIKGNKIDVLMESEAKASSEWGRRTVKVKILD